jgi:hypothetical protein
MTQDMTPLVHLMAPMTCAQPGYRLIFAYDRALMDEDRFKSACPTAWRISTARLMSRRFTFNEDGIAAPVPCRGSAVYGIIWEVLKEEQEHLEFLLDVPGRLDRYGAFARGPDQQEMIACEYYAPRLRKCGKRVDQIEIVQLLAVAHRWRLGAQMRGRSFMHRPWRSNTFVPFVLKKADPLLPAYGILKHPVDKYDVLHDLLALWKSPGQRTTPCDRCSPRQLWRTNSMTIEPLSRPKMHYAETRSASA